MDALDTLVSGTAARLGPLPARAALVAAGLGILGLLAGLSLHAGSATLACLAAAWLFFTALASGALALSAAARVAQGRWAEPLAAALEAGASFFPASFLLLAIMLITGNLWLGRKVEHGLIALTVRCLVGAAALFLSGRRFARLSRAERWSHEAGKAGVIYLLLYVLVLSLWTSDLVIGLGHGEPSLIVPAQSFVAALLSAIAWAALLTASGAVPARLRHDLGKLLFGFCGFWAYFVWCSYLPVWYANLPQETGELIDRTVGAWNVATIAIVILCFVGPFALLWADKAKLQPRLLGFCSLGVLLGLGAERFLLVLRPLELLPTAPAVICGVLVTAGLAGLFVLLVASALPERPRDPGEESESASASEPVAD